MDKKTINIYQNDILDILDHSHLEFTMVDWPNNDIDLVFRRLKTEEYYRCTILYDDENLEYADGNRAIQVYPKTVEITVYE